MSIQALGYLGVGSDKLDDWTAFAVNWLGMQAVDRGAGQCAFRMDDRTQRLVIDRALADETALFWGGNSPMPPRSMRLPRSSKAPVSP